MARSSPSSNGVKKNVGKGNNKPADGGKETSINADTDTTTYSSERGEQSGGLPPEVAEHIAYDDPLVLDLDGDGIELVALEGSGAFFDVDGDGIAERTGWVSPDDGLLAYDRNANGIIDGVDELFGKGETYSARGDTAHEACTGRLHSLRAMNIRDNDTTLACRKLAA